MKLTNPILTLHFLGNDIQGSATQIISNSYIINRSVTYKGQLLNGLKSSSDTLSLQLQRNCPSIEDIIVTEGDVEAVLIDNGTTIYTGFLSTNYSWTVAQNGKQVLSITLESRGTRLLSLPYIETGKIFFDDTASSVIYSVCSKVGITIATGHDRVLLQPVSKCIEADTTCKQILDDIFYECDAAYYFNNLGQLCVYQINPDTSGATSLDKDDLYVVNGNAVRVSKKLRTYKGSRIRYWALGTADNYLVYRNTTEADDDNYCNLTLQSGEYFDGTEIYTSAEWSTAIADTFRDPAYIGAVNAASESAIVGSNKIVNISNLSPKVKSSSANLTATFTNVAGGYFELVAHNAGGSAAKFTQLDLMASIVYQKSVGIVRTQINGVSSNKVLLDEELTWIHDKTNAQRHANMVSQYHQYAGATYSFHTNANISLGDIVHLNENYHSNLDVYVLVTNCTKYSDSDVVDYTGVGVSTFNLTDDVFYQTLEAAKQSGAAGPQGLDGASAEVQYALGDSLTEPPTAEMMWGNADMLWNSDEMEWDSVIYTDTVPALVDGYYIWMRQRVGNGAWQYSRLTGEEGEEAKIWDFTMNYETYKRNVRLSGFNPVVTLKKIIQGYSTTGSWNCDHGTIVPYDGTTAHLSIPYNNNYDTLTVTLSDGTNTRSRTLNVIDVSNLDHDFGIWTSATLPVSYVDADGVTQPVYDGDFFVAGDVNGDGTDWTGDDNNTYKVGVPYIYSSGWNHMMTATQTNTERMLQALGDVLNDPNIQPSTAALYGWFENLVAKNAVIENLFSKAITVLSPGYIKGGSRYDSAGNVSDWSEKGFWFSYDGTLKASLQSDDNGNTFVGTDISATTTTTGSYNTALGYQAMYSNISGGDYNVGIGYQALYGSTTGDYNVALGFTALYSNVTGSQNIAVGYKALNANTGSYNIGIGYQSMLANTSGVQNTAIGNESLLRNTIGNQNTAIGDGSLIYCSSGSYNVGVGQGTLSSVTTGENNLGLGYAAGVKMATGSYQMNLNDSLIYLEFGNGRTAGQIYNVLSKYYSSAVGTRYVGCTGTINNLPVIGMAFSSTGILLWTVTTNSQFSLVSLTSGSSTTFSGRTMLCFINPSVLAGNREDCLS